MESLMAIIDYYFKDSSGDLNIFGKISKIILILAIVKLVSYLTNRLIDRILKSRSELNFFANNKRASTIGSILKNIFKYTLYFIGIIMILDVFNINTTSIIATAGIGGLAIGFGAQSLVKDVITGFFILIEDQYAVGDFVIINSYQGTVEEMSLRVTKLRDFSGDLHIIPNGIIQVVTNKTRGAMRALVRVLVTYDEDIDRVMKILEKVIMEVKATNEEILEGPNILGITDLGESYVTITIVARTKPMSQWSVEREIRKKVKEAFQRENIKVPYRKIVIGGSYNA